MITVKQLSDKIQNELNDNQSGLVFQLFTDAGKFKKSLKTNNTVADYINAMVVNTSSEITNTNDGIIVGTMVNRIEFAIRLKDFEEDLKDETGKTIVIGNETWIPQIRSVLDNYFASAQYFTEEDSKGTSFDVSVAFSVASTGIRNQIQFLGDSLTFIVFAYYNIVQSGENSRSYEVFLDGVRVPYSAITPRRAPTHEQDTYNASNGVALATISNTVFSVSLECPSFVDAFSQAIKNYIVNGERNVAHFLRLKLRDLESTHLVFFGECSATAQGVLNVGQYISFIEAVNDYDLISFPETFITYVANAGENTLNFGETVSVYNSFDGSATSCNTYSFNNTSNSEVYIVCNKEATNSGLTEL